MWTSSLPLTRVRPASRSGLVTGHPDHPQTWDIGSEKMRVYVLDVPSGDTVTIVIDPRASGSDFQSLIDQAAPVVESFDFLN